MLFTRLYAISIGLPCTGTARCFYGYLCIQVTPEQAMQYISDMLRATSNIHSHGIFHTTLGLQSFYMAGASLLLGGLEKAELLPLDSAYCVDLSRADVRAIGGIAFHLLARRPYSVDDWHLASEVIPQQYWPEPATFIMKLLTKDINNRPTSQVALQEIIVRGCS